MASGLNAVPKPHPENVEWIADFAEVECLRRHDRNVSLLDVAKVMQRDAADERNLADETVRQRVDDAFTALGSRLPSCGRRASAYPYRLKPSGTLLEFSPVDEPVPDLYLFLLLLTRMNMNTQRTQGGTDGTRLFERVCAVVAERYWGGPGDGVESLVFGTGRYVKKPEASHEIDRSAFGAAVDDLCRRLGEGVKHRPKSAGPVRAQDGKLDVVVWRRFADQRGSQLIGFGQCKTGTNWEPHLAQLQPETFFDLWTHDRPCVTPVRLFFTAERVGSRWYERARTAGIFFDRCRIVEWARDVPDELAAEIRKWVVTAARSESLLFP